MKISFLLFILNFLLKDCILYSVIKKLKQNHTVISSNIPVKSTNNSYSQVNNSTQPTNHNSTLTNVLSNQNINNTHIQNSSPNNKPHDINSQLKTQYHNPQYNNILQQNQNNQPQINQLTNRNINLLKPVNNNFIRNLPHTSNFDLFIKPKSEAECENIEEDEIKLSKEQVISPEVNKLKEKIYRIHDKYTEKRLGLDQSAYLFDFLDSTLQNSILQEFYLIWNSATQNQIVYPEFNDPFSLRKILFGYDINKDKLHHKLNNETENFLLNTLSEIIPYFSQETWRKSLNNEDLYHVIRTWKWDTSKIKDDPIKYFIYHYDFNGDGRLSVREFLVASIHANYDNLGSNYCYYCYEKIVQELIDPIFEFCDCDKNGYLSADELWVGLQMLKESHKYNFYNCKINQSEIRTSVINDFILKADRTKTGVISKKDFRYSILLGYWNRHTYDRGIVTNSSLNGRDEVRWLNGYDTECRMLHNYKNKN